MQRCKWCVALFPLLLFTSGCISTLPPPATTYSFDRRCLPVSSELRNVPVSDGEKLQGSNESVQKAAAATLYSPIAVL